MTGYRAVLWDFGGVFTPSPFAGLRAWAGERSLDVDVVFATIFGPYERDTDHHWHRLERGETTLKEAMGAIVAEAQARGFELDGDNPFSFLGAAMEAEDRSAMVELVRDVRTAGMQTGLVTNNVAEFGDGWRALLPIDELFHHVIDSSAVGVRKPDPAIYELAVRTVGVAPHEVVFLDDLPSNIAAAEALGLTGVLVPERDAMSVLPAVRELLDLV